MPSLIAHKYKSNQNGKENATALGNYGYQRIHTCCRNNCPLVRVCGQVKSLKRAHQFKKRFFISTRAKWPMPQKVYWLEWLTTIYRRLWRGKKQVVWTKSKSVSQMYGQSNYINESNIQYAQQCYNARLHKMLSIKDRATSLTTL